MINNKTLLNHKKSRIEQLSHFEFVRFRCLHEDEAQPGCKKHDDEIERTTNKIFTYHWLNCTAERCGCQLYGESEISLKRKNIELPK